MWTNYFISLVLLFLVIATLSSLLWGSSVVLMMEVCSFSDSPFMMSYIFDSLSIIFLSMVSLVSIVVFIYSLEYMRGSVNKKTFSSLVIVFVASMLLLSVSENAFTTMVWWDLLGLSSVCLVFFFQSESSMMGGMVTFCSNRIGDCCIIIAILYFLYCGSFGEWMSVPVWVFIMISAFTKSAQFPFSSWLPLAMAAPTPVSSLVHSSTLVTAGILLISRFYPFLPESGKFWGATISGLTMIMASTCAIFSFDLKKVIAFSTMSHISLMFVFALSGFKECALTHMFTHALYKSSLFMASGFLIHSSQDSQDVRELSAFVHPFPVFQLLSVSSLSMIGMPFFTGAISKEILLSNSLDSAFLSLVFFLSAFTTCLYTFRFLKLLVNYSFFPMMSSCTSNQGILYFYLSLTSAVVGGLGVSVIFLRVGIEKSNINESTGKLLLLILMITSVVLGASFVWKKIISLFTAIGELWGLTSVASCLTFVLFGMSLRTLYFFDSKGVLEKVLKSTLGLTGSLGKQIGGFSLLFIPSVVSVSVISLGLVLLYTRWT